MRAAKMRESGFVASLLTVAVMLIAGCSTTENPVTQVLVSLEAEASVAQRLTAVVAETYDVRSPYSIEAPHAVAKQQFDVDPQSAGSLRFPFSFGVRKNDADRFLLVLTGFADDDLIIERKLQVDFVEHQSLLTRVVFGEACLERGCSSPSEPDWFTNTCHPDQGGACSAVEVAPTTPVTDEDAAVDIEGATASDGGTSASAPAPANPEGGSSSDASDLDASVRDGSEPEDAAAEPGDAAVSMADPDAGATDAQGPGTVDASDASSHPMPDATMPDSNCYRVLAGDGGAFSVQAGTEVHPRFLMDAPWGDASIEAVKLTPIVDNASILKRLFLHDARGNLAAAWFPGLPPIVLPDDVGLYLPSGKMNLSLEMHYQNLSSTVATDASGIEVCVTDTPRAHTAGYAMPGPISINIPPGVTGHEARSTCNVNATEPVTLVSGLPMMRVLGTRSKLSLNDVLLADMPFAYAQHKTYPLNRVVRSGDRIVVSCFYSNPGGATVRFGSEMSDEYCFNLLLVYPRGGLMCGAAL